MSEEAGMFGDAPEVDPTLELEEQFAAEDAGEIVPDAPDAAADAPEAPTVGPARARGDGGHPTVPLPEVKALREKLAEREQLLAAEREKWARLDERLQFVQRAQQAEAERKAAEEKAKQQAQQDPPPDPTEDPDGYREWQLREIQRRQDAFEAQQQQFVQQQQQREVQSRWQRLEDNVTQYESRFIARAPDYMTALQHVIENRVAFWRSAGHTDEQIFGRYQGDLQADLQQERLRFLDGCVRVDQQGNISWIADPAERMYMLAQQIGYQPGAAAPAQNGNGAQVAQIQQQGGVPPAPAQPPRQVQMRQQGVEAAQRQPAGGQPGDASGALTLDRVIAMDLAEFAWWQANNPDALKRAMS